MGCDRVAIPTGRHAVLTFALPEDEDALSDALNGERWRLVCWRLAQDLRGLAKYSEEDTTRDRAAWARTKLREAIEDEGLAREFDR